IVSAVSLEQLPPVGAQGKVYVHLVHTDDAMALYGFATERERQLFWDLLKVDGIGPKGAIKVLTNISVEQFMAALDGGDIAVLEKVPGVGKKTAAKMVLALKGKLTIPDAAAGIRRADGGPYAAVVQSLQSMGYDRRDCETAVARAAETVMHDAAMERTTLTEKEDAVFRGALMLLAT
ncbi:MAG: Holliday junction branch migration protein RuvA, partial [Treponema sp.]|nr:Holliday junction branch migration protein RuvA [Treponema sp.]